MTDFILGGYKITADGHGSYEIKRCLLHGRKIMTNLDSIQLRSWHLVPSLHGKIDGETVETVADFILGGSKITVDGDCSHEIKRCLLLGRKVMTNLDSIFKSRDIANKGPSSQGYGFSSGHVWM